MSRFRRRRREETETSGSGSGSGGPTPEPAGAQTAPAPEETALGRSTALLAALAAHDPSTAEHCREAAVLARRVGERLGFDEERLDVLQNAALLHDVGKLLIPAETLCKPQRLEPHEWDLVKRHPLLGANLLGGIESLERVALVVLQHHERPDGTGYPHGIGAREMLPESSVISVCDAFEAMVSPRPYQSLRSPAAALAELKRCAGSQFAPGAVEAISAVVESELAPHRSRGLEPDRCGLSQARFAAGV